MDRLHAKLPENLGMLWLNNDKKKSFKEQLLTARDFFYKKFGAWPQVVFMNPKNASEFTNKVTAGLTIKTNKSIQDSHIWLSPIPSDFLERKNDGLL